MKRIKRESDLIVNDVRKKLDSDVFVRHCRASEKDFTRDRKLPFKSLILFMLNIVKQTLQKELTHFISLFGGEKVNSITKSAYCQSRMKLKHTGFIELNNVILKTFYTRCSFKKWNNFVVLGVDGSTLNLPYSTELINEFGTKVPKNQIMPRALISSCYDLLNDIIINYKIDKSNVSERSLVLNHIANLHKINHKTLMIFDRGYGALWLMFYLLMKNVNFVMRLKIDFPEVESFLKSDDVSRIVNYEECSEKSINQLKKLGLVFHSIKIRLVKVILDDGTIEVLATSLLDEKKYPLAIFKDLYFRRWGIEINFDRLKNKIQVENFTGLSKLSILQDCYANMFILNLQSIIARDVQSEIDETKTDTKHKYNLNKNLSLGYMKDRVVNILTSNRQDYMDELRDLFKIEPNPIRKGRKFPRDFSVSKRKYNINQKKAV